MYKIQVVTPQSPDYGEKLRQEMIGVLSYAYQYPEKVIDKRFFQLDKIFLLRKDDSLLGFCCYVLIDLPLPNETIPTVFLGIMAASPKIQNTGLVLKAMDYMVQELQDTNPNPGVPRVIWATTASPSSLTIFRRYFNNVSPDKYNHLRPEHDDFEKAMRLILLQGKEDTGSQPMIIKNLTPLSAYSSQENNRIQLLLRKQPHSVFQKPGIDETRGDRLIMIGNL